MISGGNYNLSDNFAERVSLLINAAGCEQRSGALIQHQCVDFGRLLTIRFPPNGNHVAIRNQTLMSGKGALIVDDYRGYFRSEFRALLHECAQRENQRLHVSVDVSSMNRSMIATVIISLASVWEFIDKFTIFYLPSSFATPSVAFPATEKVGAVIPELSGFNLDPRLPFALAMGVGYEYGVAVGLINQIEPRLAMCLRAVGIDPRFEQAVRQANLNFDFGPSCQVGEYNIVNTVGTFQLLDDICYGLVKENRLVIVPLGPKIFASLAILCGVKYLGSIAVWRVVTRAEVFDAIPAGPVLYFQSTPEDMNFPKSMRIFEEMTKSVDLT